MTDYLIHYIWANKTSLKRHFLLKCLCETGMWVAIIFAPLCDFSIRFRQHGIFGYSFYIIDTLANDQPMKVLLLISNVNL